MPSSINDYRKLIEQPWGKMFYDALFHQLDLPEDHSLNILDFGAGFCVTASHYAPFHHVTAIEPSKEMLDLRRRDNCSKYACIHGGIEEVRKQSIAAFDLVICHNVLEYVPDKERILTELANVLKQGGRLSIVKHNPAGRILAYSVFSDDPEAALVLLEDGDHENNMFGKRDTYSNEYLIKQVSRRGLSLEDRFGLRTFFGLSSNNDKKYTKKWYDNMLALEMKTCNLDEYKNIAFFNHLIFRKIA